MRFRLLALALLTASSALAEPPLQIAVEDAAGPWSRKDGTGYTNEIVTEAFKAVGVETQLEVVPYARCKYLALEGKVAACFNMSPEPGHENEISLSKKPLFTLASDYFENKKRPLKVKTPAKLPKGTVVGIVIGYEYPPSVAEARARGVIFEDAKDEITNLKKLSAGRLDAVIINQNNLKRADKMIEIAEAKDTVAFAFHGGELASYIGFSRKHPQGSFAEKKFNEGYQKISADGSVTKITQKWVGKKSEPDYLR